jgi:tetratricopeptide (TPR) repeat protein
MAGFPVAFGLDTPFFEYRFQAVPQQVCLRERPARFFLKQEAGRAIPDEWLEDRPELARPSRSTSGPWPIREKALGPEHPDVATSLNNLAELYRDQGQYGAAEPLYKRSLAILEKALGPQHIYVGYSLGNLAGLYKDQGQYGAAEPLYKRALAILEKALGPEHPDVALSLHNLALLYNNQGQYGAAEPLYKRALARGAAGLYRHAGAGRRGRGTKSGLPEDCSFYLGSSWLVHNFWHLSPVTLNGEPLATPEALDQQTLVEAAQADPARFLDLYDRHFHHVWAYVIRRTANRAEAEDVTSDVFRRALENLRGYEWRGIPFAAWLLRIAANALAIAGRRLDGSQAIRHRRWLARTRTWSGAPCFSNWSSGCRMSSAG